MTEGKRFRPSTLIGHVIEKIPDRGRIKFGQMCEGFLKVDKDSITNLARTTLHANEGYKVILLPNHESFFDGIVVARISREIVTHSSMKGFDIVVASTMIDGKQGEGTDRSVRFFNPYMRDSGIKKDIPTVRKKDEHLYKPEEIVEINTQAKIALTDPNPQTGIIAFMEGVMEGGRPLQDGSGRIKGLQEVIDMGMNTVIANFLRQGTRFVILNVGIDGSYQLSNPTTKIPPLDAVVDVFRSRKHYSVQVAMNEPATDEMLIAQLFGATYKDRRSVAIQMIRNPLVFTNAMMKNIANLLPEHSRGFYR